MEIKLNMDVSAKEFFDVLYDSIIYDIKASTNKKVSKSKIKKGYTYSKKLKTRLGKEGTVKVEIKEFDLNHRYTVSFNSTQGENIVSYEVEQLDDDSLNVKYTEDFVVDSKMKSLNFSMMSFLFKRGNRKKGLRNLVELEKFIIQNRGVDDD